MGRLLLKTALETQGVELVGGTVRSESEMLGVDVGVLAGKDPVGLNASDQMESIFEQADCVIDFTGPQALSEHLRLCLKMKTALVLGTTGFSEDDQEQIETAAKQVPIVQAANMSLGVTLLSYLSEVAASVLPEEFDIEIFEAHHRHKKDAPSGTALMLGQAAAEGRGVSLSEKAVYDRQGARQEGDIGFSVLRGGDIIGEHTVSFNGMKERLELTHKAGGRDIFASGAIRAALFVCGKPARIYSMKDVLGLHLG